MSVVIETTVGDITVDLYLTERPKACLNFIKLCKIKYYNLCVFYKIERNFIAQTGDPTSTGRGGHSIYRHLYGEQAAFFDAEHKPRLKHEKLGTLSMVNNGNNMHGSQFFFTLGENLTYLDEVHTVFGEVTEGFDVLLKINEAICDPTNRPYQDIRITHTVILHDPYDDPVGLEIPDASPIPTKEMLDSEYIGADEEIDDTKGKSAEEIEERIKESEAKARATILEMVGDIPEADVKPPENVLFVCKLNPVTTAEDLEIIFSRFGSISSCEVIKDQKTGESLQYAFIEFEKEEDCENAYFKMDNVLIDDRRIHVDFSQSVSKMNFDMRKGGEKGRQSKGRDFVIKENTKKTDGYEMLFDIDHTVSDVNRETYGQNQKRKQSEANNYYRDDKSKQSSRTYKDNYHSRGPSKETSSRRKTYRTNSRSVSPVVSESVKHTKKVTQSRNRMSSSKSPDPSISDRKRLKSQQKRYSSEYHSNYSPERHHRPHMSEKTKKSRNKFQSKSPENTKTKNSTKFTKCRSRSSESSSPEGKRSKQKHSKRESLSLSPPARKKNNPKHRSQYSSDGKSLKHDKYTKKEDPPVSSQYKRHGNKSGFKERSKYSSECDSDYGAKETQRCSKKTAHSYPKKTSKYSSETESDTDFESKQKMQRISRKSLKKHRHRRSSS